jgi:hypothetical protein
MFTVQLPACGCILLCLNCSILDKVERFFSSSQRSDRLWNSSNLLSKGYEGFFPGLKRPGRETDGLPPPSAGVKTYEALPHILASSWPGA